MTNETHSVASTILAQLGGNKFLAMTGASNLLDLGNGLQFKIGRGARDGITHARIVLRADDTYDVEFHRVRGVSVWAKGEKNGVYADQLRAVFTDRTGFDCTL